MCSVFIDVNDTRVILEGKRDNLFIDAVIRIVNPRSEPLLADETVLGIYTRPTSKKNFRGVILNIINFFARKNEISQEVENDLRKLVNQNVYKEVIGQAIIEFKNKFITDYDALQYLTINRKNVIISVPNNQDLKIKLIFLFTSKYHYGFHLVVSKEDVNFSLTRWRKLLNTNSIIKQITDWEEVASANVNSELFFQSKMELKSYLIANKQVINSLLFAINDYTKKVAD